jgi:phosphonate transport system permease protein
MAHAAASGPVDAAALFWRHYRTIRRQRLIASAAAIAVFVAAFIGAAIIGELDPVRIWAGLPRLHEFVVKMIPELRRDHLAADLGEWFLPLAIWLRLLVETILIAFLATVFGAAAGLALCFAAARNLAPSYAVFFLARRALEIARTVPDLVYALIFVFCFGVGPLAGVLAIAVHTAGALGKLFAEANENVEPGQFEGIRAAGGNWFQAIRFGVVPQVLPNYVSYALLRFEINVRSSSVIGFVGAGGLGQEIATALGMGFYTDLSALFLIILVTVATIDILCERIRHRFIRLQEAHP